MDQQKNSLMIPIAIVVAGALVGGALYFSGGKGVPSTEVKVAGTANTISKEIALNPVSPTDHILGTPDAKVVLVEFSDTECPFCKVFNKTLTDAMTTYGKDGTLAWVYRHFPIDQLHPKSRKEAEATECVNELGGADKFWAYIGKIYGVTPSNNGLDPAQLPKLATALGIDEKTFNTCLSSGKYATLVQSNYTDAAKAGGQGTPYSVFIAKNPISKATEDFITTTNDGYVKQMGANAQNLFTISPDKMKVGMSGALPAQIVDQIIKLISA